MSNSTKDIIDISIKIISTLLIIVTIVISTCQFGKALSHSLVEAQQQMALEQTSELPLQVTEFCALASNVAVGIFLGPNQINEEQELEFQNSKKEQDEILPIIKDRIFAYGTNDAIKIFTRFEESINNHIDNQISVETYYLLPLLLAQVKLDVTGEAVDPLIFFNSLMPQFKEHNVKAKEFMNRTIDEFKLNDKLK